MAVPYRTAVPPEAGPFLGTVRRTRTARLSEAWCYLRRRVGSMCWPPRICPASVGNPFVVNPFVGNPPGGGRCVLSACPSAGVLEQDAAEQDGLLQGGELQVPPALLLRLRQDVHESWAPDPLQGLYARGGLVVRAGRMRGRQGGRVGFGDGFGTWKHGCRCARVSSPVAVVLLRLGRGC